jgi:hypothetical protein
MVLQPYTEAFKAIAHELEYANETEEIRSPTFEYQQVLVSTVI